MGFNSGFKGLNFFVGEFSLFGLQYVDIFYVLYFVR